MGHDPQRDGPHYIEGSLIVYLKFRRGQWAVDGTETDESSELTNAHCTCQPEDKASCYAALTAADAAELPSGRALARLLIAAESE
uniref:hypothetical protein n=1 Tax=Amycolatopsis sp. CA-096443 TaxID=3239919 RepID=UPI003F499317